MPASYSTSTTLLDSLITAETLAARLRVRSTTLAEWRVKGYGPPFIRVGRTPLYRPEAVDSWLLAQEHASTVEEVA